MLAWQFLKYGPTLFIGSLTANLNDPPLLIRHLLLILICRPKRVVASNRKVYRFLLPLAKFLVEEAVLSYAQRKHRKAANGLYKSRCFGKRRDYFQRI